MGFGVSGLNADRSCGRCQVSVERDLPVSLDPEVSLKIIYFKTPTGPADAVRFYRDETCQRAQHLAASKKRKQHCIFKHRQILRTLSGFYRDETCQRAQHLAASKKRETKMDF